MSVTLERYWVGFMSIVVSLGEKIMLSENKL